MIPILYSSITEGTTPSHYGVGALSDCLACEVNEERNGIFELTLIYAAQGIHAESITVGACIKAKPNYTDAPQLFRIYKIGKAINGRFEVNAQHISYDLSGKVISSGTANNCASACALLTAQAGNFTISTTKTTLGDFSITAPSSVRSWFGGKAGSLLDVYGGGEWHYDNFTCTLKANRGDNRGVTIRYGKNLTELEQTIDCSNLYTHVLCYYKPNEGPTVTGNEVATGLSGTKRVLILDVTGDFESIPTITDLDNYATAYIGGHNLTTPDNNFTLNFVQNGELTERVDLCDTVNVYFEALGISASVKCIRVKWDVLKDRYIETEFGTAKVNIADTLSETTTTANTASADASEALNIANSKKRVFISTPVPPYDIGDIWTDSNDIYYCTNPRHETVTGTAEGAIVSFNTLIGGPLTGCTASITGSQDLNGYSKPWAGGCGKNLVYETISDANIDGTGTIVAAVGFSDLQAAKVTSGETYTIKTDAGQFIGGFFTSEPAIGSVTYDGQRIVQNNQTFTAPTTGFVVFRTTHGYSTPQLEVGNISTTWEPYENICPLTAYTETNITRTGKNLFINNHVSASSGGVTYTTNEDGTIDLTGTASATVFIAPMGSTGVFFPAGTYTMKKSGNANIQMLLRTNDISGNDAIRATTVDVTRTLTAGNYATLIRIASGTVTDGITLYPQLEVGNDSTYYLPYEQGETYTVSFGAAGTVYKGTIDMNAGTLTVTHAVVDLGTLAWIERGTGFAGYYRMRAPLVTKAIPNTDTLDAVCDIYEAESANATCSLECGISGDVSGQYVWVYDPNYNTASSAAAFKTSVTGHYLAYELETPATYTIDAQLINSTIGLNNVWADTGNISIAYIVDGFTTLDWELASNYINDSALEDRISLASDVITGTLGGYVVWHDSDNDGQPDEILIMNKPNIAGDDPATKVWRWNAGGLGYSTKGYAGPYDITAINSQGQLVADAITTGNLDAAQVTIQHLKAAMFEGGKLTLGGSGNAEGVFQLLNKDNMVIGEMNKDGLKFYGAGPEGARPYVLINNTVGFQGCDANGNAIFWVNRDEFTMEKCVARSEISACGKMRMIPVTIKDENDQIINDGVAFVAIVQ